MHGLGFNPIRVNASSMEVKHIMQMRESLDLWPKSSNKPCHVALSPNNTQNNHWISFSKRKQQIVFKGHTFKKHINRKGALPLETSDCESSHLH